MFLDPHEIAVSIVGTDHKHMELILYEKDILQIKEGQRIQMYTASDPNRSYEGEVFLIDKSIDQNERTIKVHGHFKEDVSTLENLLPEMYIEGEIETFSQESMGLSSAAIIGADEKYYVLKLVSKDENTFFFEKREVIPGKTHNGYTKIMNPEDFDANSIFLGQ